MASCRPRDLSLPSAFLFALLTTTYLPRALDLCTGDLLNPGIEPSFVKSPALAGVFFTRRGLTFPKKSCVATASAWKPRTAVLSSACASPSCRACCSQRSFSRCTSSRSASRACGSGFGENPLRGAVVLCLGYPRKQGGSPVRKQSAQM